MYAKYRAHGAIRSVFSLKQVECGTGYAGCVASMITGDIEYTSFNDIRGNEDLFESSKLWGLFVIRSTAYL